MTRRNLYSVCTNSLAAALALTACAAPNAHAQGLFGPPVLYQTTSPNPVTSVAVGDFDGDSSLDLALVVGSIGQSGVVNVMLGNGDGTFQPAVSYAAGRCPYAVAAGDFNGDGNLDLAVTNTSDSTVSILLGNGDGTFGPATNFAAGIGPSWLAVGDFNGDGRPDLVVANGGAILGPLGSGGKADAPSGASENTVSILLGNGDGTFQAPIPVMAHSQPDSIAVADFNADGKLDLAVTNYYSNDVSILLGNGDGTFGAPFNIAVRSHPISVASADFNGDGLPDLAVADGYNNSNVTPAATILLGNGDGTFKFSQAVTVGQTPTAVAAADFNGDGYADVAVSDEFSAGVSAALGNGDGTFQPAVLSSDGSGQDPLSLVVGDFNGDGKPDLAVGLVEGKVSVLLNTSGPVVSLSATSIDFGQVAVGTMSPVQKVTLTNTGTAALDITSVTLTGTNPKDFVESNNCGSSVAIGASCTLRLAFRPLARGTRTASVTITDNAANSPQSISLSGTGEPK